MLSGPIRDAEAFLARNLPVYAVGITHRGPYRVGPGEIAFPIRIGAQLVNPGDLVLGDLDGALALPRDAAETVLRDARRSNAAEAAQMLEIENETSDRSWVDRALQDAGCEFVA